MREKLNSNPIAQVVLVVILIAGVAFLLLKGGGGGSEEGSTAATSTTAKATTGESSASPTSVADSTGGATSSTSSGVATASDSTSAQAGAGEVPSGAFPVSVPNAPLPAAVSHAYKDHKIIVLLVVRSAGIDDQVVKSEVELLKTLHTEFVQHSGLEDQLPKNDADLVRVFRKLAVFIVSANKIAHYAAITVGVEVQQVPALIVMRPRSLSGGIPQASVSYGFQTTQSAAQAIIDATYKGPEVPYHPH